MRTLCALIILLSCSFIFAKDIYVDAESGNDTNKGNLQNPFRTLTMASSVMAPGDVCYIRKGVYRETLITEADQLTFRSCKGEYVLITGQEVVDDWSLHQGKFWKAAFTRSSPPGSFKASMVFVNGKRMNWARYPNEDGNMLNNQHMRDIEVGADTLKGPRYLGTFIFDDLPSPVRTFWEGAYEFKGQDWTAGASIEVPDFPDE